jgi:2-C-methyl-D-erythritol 4-phosphate cytidylyltransferase
MEAQVLHYPRLDTVMMVEDTLKSAGEYPSKRQLWMQLPRKTMYQTFNLILDYLEDSGKILIDKDGAILWTHNPKLLEGSVKAR